MNLLTRNSPHYHLLKHLLFLLKHTVEATKLTSDASTVLLSARAEIADYFREYRNKNHCHVRPSTFRGWRKETTTGEGLMSKNIRREVDEVCALLGYFAVCSGNFLQAFRENLTVPS